MLKPNNLFRLNRPVTNLKGRILTSSEYDPFEEDFKKHHIPINSFQRVLLSIGSATMAIMDPYRGDMVACLGETTGSFALEYMRSRMENSPEGSRILADKPRINSTTIDLDKLRNLPNNTFGRSYLKFLDENQVTPDSRDPVRFVTDVKLAYVLQRYREIHDFAHTLLGMNISILDEVTIKWFEAVQNKLPMCYLGALFGPLQLNFEQRKDLLKHYLPWALETGKTSSFLLNVYFEKRWDQSMDELRKELNIKPLVLPRHK